MSLSNVFQHKCINKSYRIRGKVPRTHKIVILTPNKPIICELKNKLTVIILINRILPYSAINKKANLYPPYSILNPETNSLSPSDKSKGARLVSAMMQINHRPKNAGERSHTQETLFSSLNLSKNKIMQSKAKAKITSYEIV